MAPLTLQGLKIYKGCMDAFYGASIWRGLGEKSVGLDPRRLPGRWMRMRGNLCGMTGESGVDWRGHSQPWDATGEIFNAQESPRSLESDLNIRCDQMRAIQW